MKNDKIKCVVWDLDNTLWKGRLLEDDNVTALRETIEVMHLLDKRGILQSIASKNDFDMCKKKLENIGIWELFLYPQINWSDKSESIKKISDLLNISTDTFAFVDDEIYERDEVKFNLPKILCIDSSEISKIPDMQCMNPLFVTEDSKFRRKLYISDIERNKNEAIFEWTKEEFLASLHMTMTLSLRRRH